MALTVESARYLELGEEVFAFLGGDVARDLSQTPESTMIVSLPSGRELPFTVSARDPAFKTISLSRRRIIRADSRNVVTRSISEEEVNSETGNEIFEELRRLRFQVRPPGFSQITASIYADAIKRGNASYCFFKRPKEAPIFDPNISSRMFDLNIPVIVKPDDRSIDISRLYSPVQSKIEKFDVDNTSLENESGFLVLNKDDGYLSQIKISFSMTDTN